MRFRSISTKLLAGLIAAMTVLLLADTVVTWSVNAQQLERRRVDDLALNVRERTRTEAELFDTLRAKQAAATDSLRRDLASMSAEPSERRFDSWFPDHGDGTRRSRDSL